jgi:MFS family permease
MIVGTLIFGSFSDAFGRRTAAIVDVVIATVVFLFSGWFLEIT